MKTLTCKNSINQFCNFVSIIENMLYNMENPNPKENNEHRYIIVDISAFNTISAFDFKFDKVHSCYMNNKVKMLNIKLDYLSKEDAEFDAIRCNFTDSTGKYIVVEV